MGSLVIETLAAARDLGRLHEIASVLVRHGMSDLVRRLGLSGALERAGRLLHFDPSEMVELSREEHVRRAMEELGPTFVKAGQVLAGRRDVLPPAWIAELEKLHEGAAPVPVEEIRAQLAEDLGAPPEEVFRDFRDEPLASASIAQVHRARLQSGEEVVLKVRRPGIDDVVAADVRLLTRIAELAESELPELARYRPRALVRQVARSLQRELDLRNEARSAERLAELLADDEHVTVPRVHGRWTRERLCVLEYIEGPSLGEWLDAGDAPPAERARVARRGADAVLEMVFVHGFFHADPHRGNVLLREDGRLGLVDFGMVGTLSEERRLEFLSLLGAVSERDPDGVVDVLLEWSRSGRPDESILREDCAAFVERYRNVPLGDLDVGTLLGDVSSILRDNDLFLPDDVALLLKVFVTLEGLGRDLDPDFVMSRHVEPFARRALRELRSPLAIARRWRRLAARFAVRLPRDASRLLARLRTGRATLEVEVQELDRFGETLAKSANRVTIGLVTSALIVGTAICTTAAGQPLLMWLGFASSALAGTWLIFSILRSGR